MARRRKKKRGGKRDTAIPLALTIPVLYPGVSALMTQGLTEPALRTIAGRYLGMTDDMSTFDSARFMRTYTPVIMGFIVHKGATKLGINKHVKKATMGFLKL